MKKLTLVFICLLLAIPCQARTIFVDADTPDNNDGSSWAKAYKYLQDALADANSTGDVNEIRVAQGIYTPDSNSADPNGSGDREATFQLINGVSIKGGYAGFGQPDPNARDIELYETILSGDLDGNDVDVNDPCDLPTEPTRGENSYHVVIGSGTYAIAILDGFSITAGNASGIYPDANSIGGGMFSDSGSPTVTHCAFTLNAATCAGGMANWQQSNPSVNNCTFMENWGRSFGGMWNFHSHPTVTHCAFKRNSSASGGAGMQNTHSNPTVTDCTFKDNSAGESYGYGGGMHNMWSHPAVTNCTFTNNSAPRGGGMRNHQGSSPIVAYCTFINNSAEYGGGMANDNDCRPTIVNCTFIDNSADCEGGGMYNHDNITTVTNCLFRANTANKYGGGGMYNSSSSLTITNCTFVENMAHNYGGGAMYNYAWGATTVMLNNCIFWANLADTGRQIMITRGLHAPGSATVTVHYSDFQGGTEGIYVAYPDCHVYWGGGNIDVGPLFVDSADGDYHLLPDSPCINAGDPNYVPEPNETDLDGNPRVNGGRIDMGAYETIMHEARLLILPRVINRKSRQPRIMAWLRLPQGITGDQVDKDVPLILYPGGIKAVRQFVIQNRRRGAKRTSVFAFFNKAELMDAIDTNGRVQLMVLGHLLEPGQYFYGSDTIKIIAPRPPHRRPPRRPPYHRR